MIKHKNRFFSFTVLTSILLLCFFNAGYSVAAVSTSEPKEMVAEGGEITVKNDKIAYGAILPGMNSYSAMFTNGFYQADFSRVGWNDNTLDQESTTDIEGKVINGSYPVWFDDDTGGETTTIAAQRNNGITDPWNDLSWMKVDATKAKNATTKKPFSFNTIRNWYCMGENTELLAKVSSGVPMQIDIKIDSVGPKILQYEILGNALGTGLNVNTPLISPSGKALNKYSLTPTLTNWNNFGADGEGVGLFSYWGFVACETGTYTLWIDDTVGGTSFISLKFVDVTENTLEQDTLTFGGSGEDDVPSWEEIEQNEWSTNWYSFEASAGEIYKLDLATKYTLTDEAGANGVTPSVNIFTPCCSINGYAVTTPGNPWASNFIYVPESGKVYVAIDEDQYFSINRYSMYLEKVEQMDWAINSTTKTVQINNDQVKALKWTMEKDSFVRINYTASGGGAPRLIWGGTPNNIVYKTAPKANCFQVLTPIATKGAINFTSDKKYYYYYLPAGDYVAAMQNFDQSKNSFLKIDSRYVIDANTTLKPQTLGSPSGSYGLPLALTFDPDVKSPALKYGQWFELNITKRGIYRLNTTVYGNFNGLPAKGAVAKFITLNNSESDYHDFTVEAQTNKEVEGFTVFENEGNDQYMYVASGLKWSDMHFNMTNTFAADNDADYTLEIWNGGNWETIPNSHDTWGATTEFNSNGSISLYKKTMGTPDLYQDELAKWVKGADSGLEDAFTTFSVDSYYWMRIKIDSGYGGSVTKLDHIMLSNFTIDGDLNMYLLKESPYEFCDFWGHQTLDADDRTDNFILNALSNATLEGYYSSMASKEFDIVTRSGNMEPMIYEPGIYKLFVVPAHWSTDGPLTVHFGLEDLSGWVYNPYKLNGYNLSKAAVNPALHSDYLVDGKITSGFLYNYTTFPMYAFKLNTTYLHCPNFVSDFGANAGMVMINACCGGLYNWTQLVFRVTNSTQVKIYLIYDLPWISNAGPNFEWRQIGGTFTGSNTNGINGTVEFGAFKSNFSVMIVFNSFEPNSGDKDIWVRWNLFQWNTTKMTTVATDLYTCEPVGGAGGAIPGYPLYLMLGGLMAVSAILIRKKLKTTTIR